MEEKEKNLYKSLSAALHLQEIVNQFVADNPSVKYSDVFEFVIKVRDIFYEV